MGQGLTVCLEQAEEGEAGLAGPSEPLPFKNGSEWYGFRSSL